MTAATSNGIVVPGPRAADQEPRSALELCPWLSRYPRRPRRRGRGYRATKRTLDVVVVLLLAPLWFPLYALCALAVKAQYPGVPAHFSQDRTGIGARRFRVHKLRTMVRDAEALKESLRHLNLRTWPDFKVEHDPRVTRIGRVLRATSLDELPQLFDVLAGRMSLVGPRPTSLAPASYELWQLERFDVPGGLSGLWQITSRDAPSFVERVRLDVSYVDRRCLRLDLEILLRTVPAVLRGRGAC